jgi:hypothetical protein
MKMKCTVIDSALDFPAEIEKIGKTANYYADGKFFIEIYKNGTCVFPKVPLGKEPESGSSLLTEIGNHPIDFVVKEMDDHNFIVRFSDSVFSIIFQDELAENRAELVEQMKRSSESELLVGKSGAPQDHLLIGVYARTRLLADIQNPVLAKTVKGGQ